MILIYLLIFSLLLAFELINLSAVLLFFSFNGELKNRLQLSKDLLFGTSFLILASAIFYLVIR